MARNKNKAAATEPSETQAQDVAPETGAEEVVGTDAPEVGGMEDEGDAEQAATATDAEPAPGAGAATITPTAAPVAVKPDPEAAQKAQLRAELETQLAQAQADVQEAEAKFAVVRRELDERCEARDAQVNAIDRAIGDVRGQVEQLNQKLHQVLRPAVDKINRKLDGLK